jgi:hypothetical protein
MATKQSLKKHLSIEGLLSATRKIFSSVKDPLNSPEKDPRGKKTQIPLVDCLMSGLAVFGGYCFNFVQSRIGNISTYRCYGNQGRIFGRN